VMKIVVFAVLGLLVGLGGGSAFSVLRAKKAFAAQGGAQAKTVADSLARAQEGGGSHAASEDSSLATRDSASANDRHSPSGPVTSSKGALPRVPKAVTPAPRSVPVAATPKPDSSRAAPASVTPAKGKPAVWNRAVATVEPRAAGSAGDAKSGAASAPAPAITPDKIAKIFAAMPARDAARVMVQLDDSEVQSLLGALSGKQAAAILQALPPERAAAISKAALRGSVTKP
jgi:hypothetical protein